MMKPKRIQLKRTKGWRIPKNTVVVSRPGKWGNPFKIGGYVEIPRSYGSTLQLLRDNAAAVKRFELMVQQELTPPFRIANIQAELKGKNLACWCKKSEICHADVLLKIANA